MKQVQIKKSNVVTHQAPFPTLEEAQAWVAYHENQGNFGNPVEYEVEIIDASSIVEQEQINAEALNYLASTDWMIIRQLETGVLVLPEIIAARQAARDRIVR